MVKIPTWATKIPIPFCWFANPDMALGTVFIVHVDLIGMSIQGHMTGTETFRLSFRGQAKRYIPDF